MREVAIRTRQYYAFFLLLLLVGLQGCASSNPIARAETIEQKAFAAYGSFVIAQEQAAKLVSSGELSNSAIIRIGRAEERAKEIADELLAASLEFNQVREEFEAGGTGEQRYVNAMNSLNNWAERLVPLVGNLVAAVQGDD